MKKNAFIKKMNKDENTLISNTNTDENTLTSNINNGKNTLTSNTHEEIIPLNTNTHNHNEKNSFIKKMNKDENTLISNINEDENTLTSYINNDKNTLNSNTHKEINRLTTNTLTRTRKKSLISNINKDKNTLTSNTHKDINMLTTYILTRKRKHSLISNINKDKNTLTSNVNKDVNNVINNLNKKINMLTTNILTRKRKHSLISNINKDKNTLTSNVDKDVNNVISNLNKKINMLTTNILTRKRKHSLISNINKDKNTLTSNVDKDENNDISNLNKKINTLTTNILKRKKKNSLISNIDKDKNTLTSNVGNDKNTLASNVDKDENNVISNLNEKINTLSTNIITCQKNNLLISDINKDKNTTTTNIPTILTSKINIRPSIKSCVNEFIGVEDDTRNIDNDSDQNHTDHCDGEPNNVTNDVNLVEDNMISIYCKEIWPTILNELSDPLKGIKVFESILFNKTYEQVIRQSTKNKLKIKEIKDLNDDWKLKIGSLAFNMKKVIENTKCDLNSRYISIQNQNQMDITLCKHIGDGEKENNSGINKKDLQNNITPENFKTPKLYQHSINSENRNITESVTDIKTTKYNEIKSNISSTQVIADLIKDIPLSTTVSILCPESLKSNKRNLTESDTCITRAKANIIKTQHSSIPNFDHMDVHIPPDTTASRISPIKNNLTQFDSGIKMTQSKTIESSEQSTLVSTNVCLNTHILPQCDSEIEISEIIESNTINDYEPSTPASIDITVNNPQVITTSESCYYSLNNQKTVLTQYNTDIKKIKSKITESTPTYIDLTLDSPPDTRVSSISPNMLNGQSSSTQCNTQLECYEPSTLSSSSIDLTVINLPIMTNSRLNIEKNISTEYNNGIKAISSTSMSTDLRSNKPTFSSPSLRAITPNRNLSLLGRSNIDVFVVQKDAKLSTIHLKRMRRADWKSPKYLKVLPQNICKTSPDVNAIFPIAVKRALKPNSSPPSKYPMLNKLLTRPTNRNLKLDKRNTLNTPANNQMRAPLPRTNTTLKIDKRSFILNTPFISVNNRMNAPLPPTNTIIKLDKRNIFNTTPFNNQMNAPLPDVVYESTQITNKINSQKTIQSNYSLNQHKAPHQIKPVPTAIPLLPSDIIYNNSDGV
ncbi:probable serine/threonine-protein kinase DDB_G0282963 [Acyrthosiphon pisum]|uniref:Uncharacterized protein n=1 Tax=Acyrthosiphon pisum TaxID=7029 RepID=A0A8R2A4R6_ACYPI|nr:probable serine/threonine-protein kinase DDB_G0282963 [Acyrthosiphon pisum]|eukprot:XP_001948907.3 PREDICTED: probable serine/threonine-protein kinase DDB_G0282963 [Acyrthosiphon pisum]